MNRFPGLRLDRPAGPARGVWRVRALCAIGLACCAAAAWAQAPLPRTPAPEGARVYFISPEDGAEASSPVLVRFGLANMGVAPAGMEKAATGHHHLLIDVALEDPTVPIPSDDHHRHFGGGQTEAQIDLPPGEHTLQLVLGDHLHIPHDPPIVSDRITIEVK